MKNSQQRGNAMLEFALGLVVLAVCFSGVFQYGYSMYVYNNLTTAVSNGAIFASRATYDARNDVFATQVKNVVVFGNTAGYGAPLVAGLTTANVAVTVSPAGGVPREVTVGISKFDLSSVIRAMAFHGKPNCTMKFTGKYMTAAL